MLKENLPNHLPNLPKKELAPQKINQNFSPPVSPWMNGAMETIVKITKKHLYTITRNHFFKEETLYTYLT